MSHEFQKTVAKTETLTFTWNIEGFDALRKLARLKALPSKDRLFSPEFGNNEAGHWKVALFPYGERETQKHVSLYLFCDKKHKRVAQFSMVVLDKDYQEMPDTQLGEEVTFFTGESNSWGWHEFLSVENDDELRPYLVDGDCLRVKILVKVYTGVVDDKSPRVLFNIVQNRCANSETESDDDESDDYSGCSDSDSSSIAGVEANGDGEATTDAVNLLNYPLSKKENVNSSRTQSRNPRAESCNGRADAALSVGAATSRLSASGRQLTSGRGAPSTTSKSPPTRTSSSAEGPAAQFASGSASSDPLPVASSVRRERRSVRRISFTGVTPAALGDKDGSLSAGDAVSTGLPALVKSMSCASSLHRRRRVRRRSSYCCCAASGTGASKGGDTCSAAAVTSENGTCARTGSLTSLGSENSVALNLKGKSLQNDVANFALDPRVQDLTVICEGQKFRANRFLIAARSEIFRAMLFGDFVESRLDAISINDVPLDIIHDFLVFLATDNCPTLSLPVRCGCGKSKASGATTATTDGDGSGADSKAAGGGDSELKSSSSCDANTCRGCVGSKDAVILVPRLLQLMIAADKYQVMELRARCIQALARCICAKTVVDILDSAELVQCGELADACTFYIRRNSSKLDRMVDSVRRRRARHFSISSTDGDGLPHFATANLTNSSRQKNDANSISDSVVSLGNANLAGGDLSYEREQYSVLRRTSTGTTPPSSCSKISDGAFAVYAADCSAFTSASVALNPNNSIYEDRVLG